VSAAIKLAKEGDEHYRGFDGTETGRIVFTPGAEASLRLRIECDAGCGAGVTEVFLNLEIGVSETEAVSLSDLDNVFRPYCRADCSGGRVWYAGTPAAALLQLASIEGFVFLDANKNGSAGACYTESPVTVAMTAWPALYDGIKVTETLSDGSYAFTGLKNGIYAIGFSLPAGCAFTEIKTGDYRYDSDADPKGRVSNIDVQMTKARFINACLASSP
jgi:hypothetical protein